MAEVQGDVSGPALAALLARMDPRWPEQARAVTASAQRRDPLPFYPNGWLWQLSTGEAGGGRGLRVVENTAGLMLLDGSRAAIEEANRTLRLRLEATNVGAYVCFFFGNVGDGKLLPFASTAAALAALAPDPALQTRAPSLLDPVVPPTLVSTTPDAWTLRFAGLWETLVIGMEVRVGHDGVIEPLRRASLATLAAA